MINAETKRYIDQQIDRLRREMKASLGKKSDTITISGDTVSYALAAGTASTAGYALTAGEAEVYGGTVSFAVNAGTASVYGGTVGYAERAGEADVYGGTVGYAQRAGEADVYGGTVSFAVSASTASYVLLHEGSTNVHINGTTISVDVSGGTGGGLPAPDYDTLESLSMNTPYTATSDGFLFGYLLIGTSAGAGEMAYLYKGTTVKTIIYKTQQDGGHGEYIPFCYPIPSGMTFQVYGNISGISAVIYFSGTTQ